MDQVRQDEEERATAHEAVGQSESGPALENGTTIGTFEGCLGRPPHPIVQS